MKGRKDFLEEEDKDNLVFGGDLPQRTSEFPVNQQEWAGWDGQTGRLQ